MNIPGIGGTKGIFEIFVPGVFLLLNISAMIYSLPFLDDHTKELAVSLASNIAVDVVVSVCFGYLIGILLRLLKTDSLDKFSAWWIRAFDKKARVKTPDGKKAYRLYATDEFPYIGWVGEVASGYLPPTARRFYERVWLDRQRGGKRNKQFFNFCKLVVSCEDSNAANEIYAAESFTRYIAGMYYALLFSSILIVSTIILRYILMNELLVGFIALLVTYLLSIFVIVQRFRKMRIREVEVIFAASYKNRDLFDERKTKTKK